MIPHFKTYSLSEATRKLEYYCDYQERCRKEVILKLKEIQMIPEAIDQIVAGLIQNNFLNEERFSKSYARGKFTIKKWGKNKIANELKQRGISTYNIKIALREIDADDYIATLNILAHKRLNEIKETNRQKKTKKLADYLLYRGWESHLVYKKIMELLK